MIHPMRTQAADADWQRLHDGLIVAGEELIARIVERVQAEIPFYRHVADEELAANFAGDFARGTAAIREERQPTTAELAQSERIGEMRAREGVPVEAMLGSWRIGFEETIAQAQQIAGREKLADAELQRFVRAMWAWGDVAMVREARAHRQTELELAREEHDYRATLVRRVLTQSLDDIDLQARAAAQRLDPDRRYCAICTRPGAGATARQLEHALDLDGARERRRGLVALLDGELVGFATEPPTGPLPAPVGVGPPAALDSLGASFHLARRALETAVAFGLTGAWDIPGLGLRAAIAGDPALGEHFARRYILPYRDAGAAGQGVLDTVKQFLACEMRTEATASEMHIHPNTLRYRLKRFEEETGASLRDPEQICEIWWALTHAALRQHEP
jgi:hypothetical protein